MIKRLLAFLLIASLSLSAGTVTGNLYTAGGQAVSNGTLAFTLSQGAVKTDGTGTVVATPFSCYTSTDGSIVGEPNPIASLTYSTTSASGTLAAGTYYFKIAYWDSTGVSLPGPELTAVLGATGTITINAPTLQPAAATGYKVYASATSGTETLQATVTGFGNYAQSVVLVAGSALPATNTSVCTLSFNDTLTPSYTSYSVSLTDSSGSSVSGYPQSFYLAGSTVALPSLTPTTIAVKFPSPILSVPSGHGLQSISGPLSLGAYPLTTASPVINGTPSGTGIATLTLKKGSGAVDYTTASTSYVDVDATNLALTVTIPTGWKLAISARVTALAGAGDFGLSLLDGSTLCEAFQAATTTATVALFWAITGDGASHTVKLQYKNGSAGAATIKNSTATNVPTMVFSLMPSS